MDTRRRRTTVAETTPEELQGVSSKIAETLLNTYSEKTEEAFKKMLHDELKLEEREADALYYLLTEVQKSGEGNKKQKLAKVIEKLGQYIQDEAEESLKDELVEEELSEALPTEVVHNIASDVASEFGLVAVDPFGVLSLFKVGTKMANGNYAGAVGSLAVAGVLAAGISTGATAAVGSAIVGTGATLVGAGAATAVGAGTAVVGAGTAVVGAGTAVVGVGIGVGTVAVGAGTAVASTVGSGAMALAAVPLMACSIQ